MNSASLHPLTLALRQALAEEANPEYAKAAPGEVRRFVDEHRRRMSGVTLKEAEKYIYSHS